MDHAPNCTMVSGKELTFSANKPKQPFSQPLLPHQLVPNSLFSLAVMFLKRELVLGSPSLICFFPFSIAPAQSDSHSPTPWNSHSKAMCSVQWSFLSPHLPWLVSSTWSLPFFVKSALTAVPTNPQISVVEKNTGLFLTCDTFQVRTCVQG